MQRHQRLLFHPRPKPLTAPVLRAEVAESAVELSWTEVSGAVRYELWVWDSVNSWRQLLGDNRTDTTHTHADVTAGTTYHYIILAVNASGEASDWSPHVTVTTTASTSSAQQLSQ